MEGEEQSSVLAPRDPPRPPKPRVSRRKKRLAAAGALVFVALFIALWGAQPQEFVTPSQLVENPSRYADREIQLRGVVTDVNTSEGWFLLGDHVHNVTVEYSALPDGFKVGKEVIARGRIVTLAPLLFQSVEIAVGHAG